MYLFHLVHPHVRPLYHHQHQHHLKNNIPNLDLEQSTLQNTQLKFALKDITAVHSSFERKLL